MAECCLGDGMSAFYTASPVVRAMLEIVAC